MVGARGLEPLASTVSRSESRLLERCFVMSSVSLYAAVRSYAMQLVSNLVSNFCGATSRSCPRGCLSAVLTIPDRESVGFIRQSFNRTGR